MRVGIPAEKLEAIAAELRRMAEEPVPAAERLAKKVQKGEFETIWPKDQASKPYIYPVPSWKERR